MATVKTKQRRKSMAGKGTVNVLEFMENQIRLMRNANRLGRHTIMKRPRRI